MELTSTVEKFDGAAIIIWFIAFTVVLLGSLWSSYEFKKSLRKQMREDTGVTNLTSIDILGQGEAAPNAEATAVLTTNNKIVESASPNEHHEMNNNNKKSSSSEDEKGALLLSVGYIGILVLLVFVVGMLLLLYFFYNVMSKLLKNLFKEKNNYYFSFEVYFIYVIFSLGAASAIYRIFSLFLDHFKILTCR